MDATGMMRDLDQIQERDDHGESSRLVLIALSGLAAACVLFAVGVWIGKDGQSTRPPHHEDPLARLDALAGESTVAPPGSAASPTSAPAMATAMDPASPSLAPMQPSAPAATGDAPTAAVPMPASTLLDESAGVRVADAPVAHLPVAAANSARLAATGSAPSAPVAPGTDGAFTLQVSSFRQLAMAQTFAQHLRQRGYRAFVTTAAGSNGITWHRVRIGPFANQQDAAHYRAQFESRERLPTFVVRRDAPLAHGG